jgi:long-subunit acyl-CoA synthetase (AMP-forming)
LITHTNLLCGGYSLDARRFGFTGNQIFFMYLIYSYILFEFIKIFFKDNNRTPIPYQDVIVCYLPLAHIFQRSIEAYCYTEGLVMGYFSGLNTFLCLFDY